MIERKQEFDEFAYEYDELHARNIRLSGEQPTYFAEYKVIDVARRAPGFTDGGAQHRILDLGCGTGSSLPHFKVHFPNSCLFGVDVSRNSLSVANKRYGDFAELCHFDGMHIPFEDDHFDIGFMSCVLHHVQPDLQPALLREIMRVLKIGGTMFVFEHNPLNPLTQHAVRTCEFDRDAKLIPAWTMRQRLQRVGFQKLSVAYRIFFPHPMRGLRGLERHMEWIPFGAQYFVLGRKH